MPRLAVRRAWILGLLVTCLGINGCAGVRGADVPKSHTMTPIAGQGSPVSAPTGEVLLVTIPEGAILAVASDSGPLVGSGAAPDGDFFRTYDSTGDRWLSAGVPATPGVAGSVTMIQDGRVLLAGGFVESRCAGPADPQGIPAAHVEPCFAALAPAEIWSLRGRSFLKAASLSSPRFGHAAVRLGDGRVLVVGGSSFGATGERRESPGGAAMSSAMPLASTEIYDATIDRWAAAAPMSTPRATPAVQLLADGRVLVVGNGGAELFDPRTGTWSASAHTPPWTRALLVRAGKDRTLVIGHIEGEPGVRARLFEAASNSWTEPRGLATTAEPYATLHLADPDQRVAIFSAHAAYVWDADRGTGVEAPLRQVRDAGSAALLADGRILLAGGATYGAPPCVSAKCEGVAEESPPELWTPPPH